MSRSFELHSKLGRCVSSNRGGFTLLIVTCERNFHPKKHLLAHQQKIFRDKCAQLAVDRDELLR
jgi:hypothetical protein